MYLNIGERTMIGYDDIVAILDLETTSVSKRTKEFLKKSEEKGIVENVSEDIPKSYVICGKDGNEKLYVSQFSSATLLKRM